jgi:RimJ/RimL family protein N-acetyltransferase
MEAPELHTDRLRLRPFRKTDFEASFALWSDPGVYQHITGRPGTTEECWSRILRYAGHWQWHGYGFWAVELQKTGELIGEIGFADFHRAIEPSLGNRIEAGWVIASQHHRQKLATEALGKALAWADANLPVKSLAAIIVPQNVASIRLAESFGFQKSHATKYAGSTTDVFHRG